MADLLKLSINLFKKNKSLFIILNVLSLIVAYGKVFLFLLPLKILVLLFPNSIGNPVTSDLDLTKIWITVLLCVWLALTVTIPIVQGIIERRIDAYRPKNGILELNNFSIREKTGGYSLTNEVFKLARAFLNSIVFALITSIISIYLLGITLIVYFLSLTFYNITCLLSEKNILYKNRISFVIFFVLLGLIVYISIYQANVQPFVALILFFLYRNVNTDLSVIVDVIVRFNKIDYIQLLDIKSSEIISFIKSALKDHGYAGFVIEEYAVKDSPLPHTLDVKLVIIESAKKINLQLRICSLRSSIHSNESRLRSLFSSLDSPNVSYKAHNNFGRATWCFEIPSSPLALSKEAYCEIVLAHRLFLTRKELSGLNENINIIDVTKVLDRANPIYSTITDEVLTQVNEMLEKFQNLLYSWPYVLMNPVLGSANVAKCDAHNKHQLVSWATAYFSPVGFDLTEKDCSALKNIYQQKRSEALIDTHTLEICELLGKISVAQKKKDGKLGAEIFHRLYQTLCKLF